MIPRRAVAFVGLWCAISIGFPADAQILRQITETPELRIYLQPAIDDAGETVATVTTGDPAGTNPDLERRVLIWDLTTMTPSTPGGVKAIKTGSVSISDDGQQVAFISTDDPLGTNQDRSLEVFVMNVDGSGLVQASFNPSPREGGVREAKLSGDGSRVVYLGTIDPLGTNPQLEYALFTFTPSSGTTVQLLPTSLSEFGFGAFDISDDGTRVAVVVNDQLWVANGGGGGSSRRSNIADTPMFLSGDGQWVVYEQQGDLRRVQWAGGAQAQTLVTPPIFAPFGLADDASWLYGTVGSSETRRVGVFSPADQLIDGVSDINTEEWVRIAVAGGSGRIVRVRETPSPDYDFELAVIDADGSDDTTIESPEFLRTGFVFDEMVRLVSLTGDGATYAYGGRVGIGIGPTDGSGPPTVLPYGPEFSVSISDDASFVVFDDRNQPGNALPGEGCFGQASLFRVNPDGSGLTFLGPERTGCTQQDQSIFWWRSFLSRDGSLIAFTDTADAYTMPASGPPETPVLDVSSEYRGWEFARDGGWIVFEDLRIRTDGTGQQAWAPLAPLGNPLPSDDGGRIAFTTTADLLGTNPSGLEQIYIWDETTGFEQLTTAGASLVSHISGDGSVVIGLMDDLRRMDVGSSSATRLTGPRERLFGVGVRDVDSSIDGRLIAFTASGLDPEGRNPDGGTELYIVDLDTPARINPGAAAPTVVTWDAEPGPLLYDVIRGDVANLQPGPGGPTIDLGPVVCVENDSPDTNTIGSADALQPVPGQVFFYLYRGIDDFDVGTGSYGASSDGDERIVAAGDCSTVVL